ncbi:MAG: hypothetical protein QY323_04620 [Patescibacteria group bacterium]|nr:MAG: hypothetical protein QY323_04620 [Patescibacteria group bacterium]
MKAHAHLPFASLVYNFLAEIDPFEECSPRTHDVIEEIAAEALIEGADEDLQVILKQHGGYLSAQLTDDISIFLGCADDPWLAAA